MDRTEGWDADHLEKQTDGETHKNWRKTVMREMLLKKDHQLEIKTKNWQLWKIRLIIWNYKVLQYILHKEIEVCEQKTVCASEFRIRHLGL